MRMYVDKFLQHIITPVDPIYYSLQLALYVLSFLEPRDLLRAAQTCHYWRILCEDNLLWKEKCREAGIEEVNGKQTRRRSHSGVPRSPWKSMYIRQHHIEYNWRFGEIRPPKVSWNLSHLKKCKNTSRKYLVKFLAGITR